MKSATLEILKYFQREGIQHFGNPYIAFDEDMPPRPPEFSCLTAGRMVLQRIMTGRWYVQWWRLGVHEETPEHIAGILAVLEDVLAANRPIEVIMEELKCQ